MSLFVDSRTRSTVSTTAFAIEKRSRAFQKKSAYQEEKILPANVHKDRRTKKTVVSSQKIELPPISDKYTRTPDHCHNISTLDHEQQTLSKTWKAWKEQKPRRKLEPITKNRQNTQLAAQRLVENGSSDMNEFVALSIPKLWHWKSRLLSKSFSYLPQLY